MRRGGASARASARSRLPSLPPPSPHLEPSPAERNSAGVSLPLLSHSADQALGIEYEPVSDGEAQIHQPAAGGLDRKLGGVAAPIDGKALLIAFDRLLPRPRRLHGHGSDCDHATRFIEKRHIEGNRTVAHHHPKWIRSGVDEKHAALARDGPATAEPAQADARLEGKFQFEELVGDLDPGGFECGGRGSGDLGLPAGAHHQDRDPSDSNGSNPAAASLHHP